MRGKTFEEEVAGKRGVERRVDGTVWRARKCVQRLVATGLPSRVFARQWLGV